MRQGDVRSAEHDDRLRAPLQSPGAPRPRSVRRPPHRRRTGPPAQHDGDRGDQPGLADLPWAMLDHRPAGVDEVSLEELAARSPDTLVLDVREPEEFAAGHVPGAVNLPQADLADRGSTSCRAIARCCVICQGGYRSLRAAQFLEQMGFEQVASVAGGTARLGRGRKAARPGRGRRSGHARHRNRVGPRGRHQRGLIAPPRLA